MSFKLIKVIGTCSFIFNIFAIFGLMHYKIEIDRDPNKILLSEHTRRASFNYNAIKSDLETPGAQKYAGAQLHPSDGEMEKIPSNSLVQIPLSQCFERYFGLNEDFTISKILIELLELSDKEVANLNLNIRNTLNNVINVEYDSAVLKSSDKGDQWVELATDKKKYFEIKNLFLQQTKNILSSEKAELFSQIVGASLLGDPIKQNKQQISIVEKEYEGRTIRFLETICFDIQNRPTMSKEIPIDDGFGDIQQDINRYQKIMDKFFQIN